MTYKGTMDAALFLVFLGRLLQGLSGKLFVIVDRLRAHDTEAVWDWLERHKERIALLFLPAAVFSEREPCRVPEQ